MDLLVQSFWAPETYLKLLFLLATSPLWAPILRAMWEEIQEALAPEGGFIGRARSPTQGRAPGTDPWTSVPLASHRAERRSAPQASGRGTAPPVRAAARPAARSGFRRP